MFTLCTEDGFMGVEFLALHFKDDVSEGRIVNQLAHVADKGVDSLVVYLVLF